MELYEIKDKIVEVWATARVIVQKYGHTKKFAKHIVALVVKENENFRDVKLAEFLGNDPIGKILGYRKKPHPSTFSKVYCYFRVRTCCTYTPQHYLTCCGVRCQEEELSM